MVLMPWGRDSPVWRARAKSLGVAEIVLRGEDSRAALTDAIDVPWEH